MSGTPSALAAAASSTPGRRLPVEIWAIAWPRPSYLHNPVVVIIKALGAGGVSLAPNVNLPDGSRVELCFVLPDGDIEIVCGAVVAQNVPQDSVHLDFTLLACADRERLLEWVTGASRQTSADAAASEDGGASRAG